MQNPRKLEDVIGDTGYDMNEERTFIGDCFLTIYTDDGDVLRGWYGDDGEIYVDDPEWFLQWETPTGEKQHVSVGARRTIELSPEAFAMLLDRSGMKVLTEGLL